MGTSNTVVIPVHTAKRQMDRCSHNLETLIVIPYNTPTSFSNDFNVHRADIQ